MAWIYKPKRNYKNQSLRHKRQDVYNTALWKKMRMAELIKHPICQICELKSKTTLSSDVHHLISFMDADNPNERDLLAYDSNNLICLCKECHSRIHNGELKGCKTIDEIKQRLGLLKK